MFVLLLDFACNLVLSLTAKQFICRLLQSLSADFSVKCTNQHSVISSTAERDMQPVQPHNQMMMMKDKDRPKYPMSAYACFIQVIREEHRRKHPNEHVDFSEFSRKCAEKWRSMTDLEKKRFEDMSLADRARFNREMSQYNAPGGTCHGRRRKMPKDPGRPKRALSAFFFFCKDYRAYVRSQHPEWRVGAVAKELGKMWEACTEKVKYETMSQEARQRYEEEMAQYRAGTYVAPKPTPSIASSGQGSSSSASYTSPPLMVPPPQPPPQIAYVLPQPAAQAPYLQPTGIAMVPPQMQQMQSAVLMQQEVVPQAVLPQMAPNRVQPISSPTSNEMAVLTNSHDAYLPLPIMTSAAGDLVSGAHSLPVLPPPTTSAIPILTSVNMEASVAPAEPLTLPILPFGHPVKEEKVTSHELSPLQGPVVPIPPLDTAVVKSEGSEVALTAIPRDVKMEVTESVDETDAVEPSEQCNTVDAEEAGVPASSLLYDEKVSMSTFETCFMETHVQVAETTVHQEEMPTEFQAGVSSPVQMDSEHSEIPVPVDCSSSAKVEEVSVSSGEKDSSVDGGMAEEVPTVDGGMAEEVPTVDGGMAEEVPTVDGGMAEEVPTVDGGMAEDVPTVDGGMAEEVPTVDGGMAEEVPAVDGGMVEEVPTVDGGMVNEVPPEVSGMLEEVPAVEGGMINKVSTSTVDGGMIEENSTVVGGMVEEVPAVDGGIVNEVPPDVGGMVNNVSGVIAEVPPEISGLLEKVPPDVGGMVNNVSGVIAEVPPEISGLLEKVPTVDGGVVEKESVDEDQSETPNHVDEAAALVVEKYPTEEALSCTESKVVQRTSESENLTFSSIPAEGSSSHEIHEPLVEEYSAK